MTALSVEYFLKQESFVQYCLYGNEEAVQYWQQYIQEHPHQQGIINEARALLITGKDMLVAEKLKPAAIGRMQEYLYASAAQPRRSRIRQWVPYMAAAAILVVAFIAWWLYQPQRHPLHHLPPLAQAHPLKQEYYHSTQQYKARKAITLPDGSFVLLGPGSELRVDSGYGKNERRLYLTGIAWFKVQTNALRPFRVITGNYITTALGTAFRIQPGTRQQSVQVQLEEGKVAVALQKGDSLQQLAVLTPGESLHLGESPAGQPEKKNFSIQQLKAWKTSDMVFRQTRVADVLQQLQLYYDLHINTSDEHLLDETFTGHFSNDSYTAVLDMLCFSLNKQYKLVSDSTVLIY